MNLFDLIHQSPVTSIIITYLLVRGIASVAHNIAVWTIFRRKR